MIAIVDSGREKFVVKLYPDHHRYALKECCAIQLLNQHAVDQVPEVLYAQTDSLPAAVILGYRRGVPLTSSRTSLATVLPRILFTIARYREITGSMFGEITGTFASVSNGYDQAAFVLGLREYWLDQIARANFLHVLRDDDSPCLWTRWHGESLLSTNPCFCHADLSLDNILVFRRRTVILDYDNTMWFVPEFDLCRLYLEVSLRSPEVTFPEFATIAADCYHETAGVIESGMSRFHWLVGLRRLSWLARAGDRKAFLRTHQNLRSFYDEWGAA
ncbi:MAG TPA: phosphotransferase [Longimicrobium sp.]